MITILIIVIVIGSVFALGYKGIGYSLILALIFGILEGIKIKAVAEKPQNKYGLE